MKLTLSQQSLILLTGRILLAFIFLLSGFNKVNHFDGTVQYMTHAGLPYPGLLVIPAIVLELGGGLMVITGWKTRWAALGLLVFIIPVTLTFHAFWNVDPAEMQNQMNHFLKNLSMMGGLLYVYAVGPGRYSLDRE
jgi:putative oxidoreductase